MSALPDDVKSQLARFQANLTSLEAALSPFLSKSPAQLETQFDAAARAQVYGGLASATMSLFSMFLAARGTDPGASEFLKKEGHRFRQYDRKIRKVAAAEELERSNRPLEVDVAAMSRFIAAAAPLSGTQREELRRVGAEAAQKKEKKKRVVEEGEIVTRGGKKRKGGKKGETSAEDAAMAFLKDALGEVKK